MFSFCGQKAGLGKGAVPEAHPHNEPLPTQATLGPDLPRRRRAGTARVAATLGLPQEQRFSLGSGGDPGAGGEEPSLVGARKRTPRVPSPGWGTRLCHPHSPLLRHAGTRCLRRLG